MATLSEMRNRIASLNIKEEAERAIYESTDKILELQADQLLHGLSKDGKRIGRYKSDKYAAKKYAQNPLAGLGNMDWILTGDLKKELFVNVRSDSFVIDTQVPYAAKLMENNGDPFGLTLESKKLLIQQRTRAILVKNIKEKLKL